jgi:hypothetical protein
MSTPKQLTIVAVSGSATSPGGTHVIVEVANRTGDSIYLAIEHQLAPALIAAVAAGAQFAAESRGENPNLVPALPATGLRIGVDRALSRPVVLSILLKGGQAFSVAANLETARTLRDALNIILETPSPSAPRTASRH